MKCTNDLPENSEKAWLGLEKHKGEQQQDEDISLKYDGIHIWVETCEP